eukprot:s1888_g11.t1
MGSGSSSRSARYAESTQRAGTVAAATTKHLLDGPSYRRRMPRNQADIGRMGTGVVCSQADEASQAQVQLLAMPQNWRKKWERPGAIFRIANQMQPKSLPPLSAPGRLLPQVPPEQLVGRSAVARMAVDYWRNEAAGRDVPTASPGSNAATTSQTIHQHLNIGDRREICAMSAKAKAYLAPPSYWSPAPGTTYAPVYSAPGVPGVPPAVPKGIPLPRPVVTLQVPPVPKAAPQRTEAAILDLKDQIGSLRKDLSNVRENVDEQLRRSEEQEEELARALRQRMNSLCSELADCGIEALKLCANLGHRPYGEAILRSRSAPGGRFWRASAPAGPAAPGAAPAPRLSSGAAPAARLFTGPPAVCGGSATAPQVHTAPWMAPLPGGCPGHPAPIPQLGLSPRRPTPVPPAPTPRMAWTEPVTALQHTARAVTASGTSLTPSASSCNVLLRPPQPTATASATRPGASQPLSPKETLTLPGRLPSPNGRYLHRPFDQDSSNAKAGDSSLKSSAENLLKLEDSVGDSTLGLGPQRGALGRGPRVQLPMADLPPEVLRRLRKTAGSPRARKLREQLAAHREAKEAARQRSRSVSAGRESKAMVPLREGSPMGHAAQWHKPGRIHSTMKEPPAGAWSPRRPSRHWTVPNATPRTRRVTQ